jgi:hypothetical protein
VHSLRVYTNTNTWKSTLMWTIPDRQEGNLICTPFWTQAPSSHGSMLWMSFYIHMLLKLPLSSSELLIFHCVIILWFILPVPFFFSLTALGFELRVSLSLGRPSYCLNHFTSSIFVEFFWDRVSRTISPCLLQTTILLLLARITGMSHQHPAPLSCW